MYVLNAFHCGSSWLTNLFQWKVLVVDEKSRKLLDATVKEDDILNHNVTSELIGCG